MLKYKNKEELEDIFVQSQSKCKKGDYLDRLANWCFDELIRLHRRERCKKKS